MIGLVKTLEFWIVRVRCTLFLQKEVPSPDRRQIVMSFHGFIRIEILQLYAISFTNFHIMNLDYNYVYPSISTVFFCCDDDASICTVF